MNLPDLPPAITARVVPVSYAHIGRLLYGEENLAVIKRISGWRRTDKGFPPALSSGRSPTFDAKLVWEWLRGRQETSDGRTRESLAAMTELFPTGLTSPADTDAAPRRNLLLAVQAMKAEIGDDRVRRLMVGIAALRRMADDTVAPAGSRPQRWFLAPVQAQRLVEIAATSGGDAQAFAQAMTKAVPAWSWLEPDPPASDLVALATQSIRQFHLADLAASVESVLEVDDGGPYPHIDASSTSGEASDLVRLMVKGLTQDSGQRFGTLYDPTVGEGRLLAVLGRDRSWKMSGQDCDLNALDMATSRLIAAGCEVDLRLTKDSLHDDQFAGQTFDLVVTDPPLPPTGTGRSRRRLPEMGPWWRHVTFKLAGPESRALILGTDQPGAQPPDEWLTAGHLLAVVETGQRMRRDVPGLTVLWVLKGPDDNDPAPVICIGPDPDVPVEHGPGEADSWVGVLAQITTDLLRADHPSDQPSDHPTDHPTDLSLARRAGVRVRLADPRDAAAIRPVGRRLIGADASTRLHAVKAEAIALLADVSPQERARWISDLAQAVGAQEPS